MQEKNNIVGQTRFLLFGIAIAVGLMAALLWLGSLRGSYTYFSPNIHETCGDPVSLRAEGYNLLGGTRYGTEPGDLGDDVELALVDMCDPAIQILPNGEGRLWFWLEVKTTGQVFPYYSWGIPDEDIHNVNANTTRNPADPLWNYRAMSIIGMNTAGTYWPTQRGEICPMDDDQLPDIAMFFDTANGFRIPQGRTRAGWVCVRYGEGERLPDKIAIELQPENARITRWVEKIFPIRGMSSTQEYHMPAVYTTDDVCNYALDIHPETILPAGDCP